MRNFKAEMFNTKSSNSACESRRSFVKIKALFLDYDGTISPISIPRSEVAVSSDKTAVLNQISKQIPIAMITTKDFSFVVERTSFAHAWSGLGGLETKIGNSVIKAPCLKNLTPYMATALDYAISHPGSDLAIEEKRDSTGTTVAFSADWRPAKERKNAEQRALDMMSYLDTLPLCTIRYKQQPFFDIFPCPVDKGRALLELKQKLGLSKGVLFMGDSDVDNAAFKVADIAVGVMHEETSKNLACDYFVEFKAVVHFFRSLLENDLCFSPKSALIMNRLEARQCFQQKKKSCEIAQ